MLAIRQTISKVLLLLNPVLVTQHHMQNPFRLPKSCETMNSRLDNVSHTQKAAPHQKPTPMCLHGESTRSMTSRLRSGTIFWYVLNCFPNLGTWISNLDGDCMHAREREAPENGYWQANVQKLRRQKGRLHSCFNKCAFVWMDESNKMTIGQMYQFSDTVACILPKGVFGKTSALIRPL